MHHGVFLLQIPAGRTCLNMINFHHVFDERHTEMSLLPLASTGSIQDYQGATRAVSRSLFRLDIATKYWNLQLQINDSICLGQEVAKVRWDLRPIYHCLSSNYALNIVRNEKLLPDGVKLIHLTVVRNCPLVPSWCLLSCISGVPITEPAFAERQGLCSALASCLQDGCAAFLWGVAIGDLYSTYRAETWKAVDVGWWEIWGLVSSYLTEKSALLPTWLREMDLFVCRKRHMGMKTLALVC